MNVFQSFYERFKNNCFAYFYAILLYVHFIVELIILIDLFSLIIVLN